MKTRHNKKRNTAFVYEALLREATVAILKKDLSRRGIALNLLKKHFKEGSILKKDLDCHRSLYENQGLEEGISEKILREAKLSNHLLNTESVFKAQSALIHDVNKELEPSVFNNFVPNYKTLASIAQVFNNKVSPKDRVLLEGEIIKNMMSRTASVDIPEDIDNVVIQTFIKKFNDKYHTILLEQQQELLTYYISSFTDNALELKTYLNEEIKRLKVKLTEALELEEIKNDPHMIQQTEQIIIRLQEFAKKAVDDEILLTVLKTQSLVKEIYRDGSCS
jgi:predicted phosphohydrolase